MYTIGSMSSTNTSEKQAQRDDFSTRLECV
jgi:hypothetical protein